MRLLDSKTLEFVEFLREDETPKYAILSHTWEDDEVTFKDMRKYRAVAESKKGFQKIRHCADQAVKDGIDYVWIDTCCIDKSSSAELSEAINSMFRWYRNSAICYAFLSDVTFDPADNSPHYEFEHRREISKARWLTRGWTLQELLAPRDIVFYTKAWLPLGTKVELSSLISRHTHIPAEALLRSGRDPHEFSDYSIAQRMSWAADRQTTRVEDEAYCLMGLFGINMPLLYGEGDKAFIRLQLEIMKESDDLSIFAWTDPQATYTDYRGLLARSISYFAGCADITWTPLKDVKRSCKSTNRGIKISVPLRKINNREHVHDEYEAVLPGVNSETPSISPNGIQFQSTNFLGIHITDVGHEQYARIIPNRLAIIRSTWDGPPDFIHRSPDALDSYWGRLIADLSPHPTTERSTFYIRQNIVLGREGLALSRSGGVLLRRSEDIKLLNVEPIEAWDETVQTLVFDRGVAHPVVTFTLHSPQIGELSLRVDANREWSGAVLKASVRNCLYRRPSSNTASGSLVFYVPLEAEVSEHYYATASLSRGLVNGRWMFLLEVKQTTLPEGKHRIDL